jgi:hypothetical protein
MVPNTPKMTPARRSRHQKAPSSSNPASGIWVFTPTCGRMGGRNTHNAPKRENDALERCRCRHRLRRPTPTATSLVAHVARGIAEEEPLSRSRHSGVHVVPTTTPHTVVHSTTPPSRNRCPNILLAPRLPTLPSTRLEAGNYHHHAPRSLLRCPCMRAAKAAVRCRPRAPQRRGHPCLDGGPVADHHR